jgi:hypothetical protein
MNDAHAAQYRQQAGGHDAEAVEGRQEAQDRFPPRQPQQRDARAQLAQDVGVGQGYRLGGPLGATGEQDYGGLVDRHAADPATDPARQQPYRQQRAQQFDPADLLAQVLQE